MKVTKPVRVILYVIGGALSVIGAFVLYVLWSLGTDHDKFAASKNDLPSYVAGRWDWSTRQRPCTDSAHAISFSADGLTMRIAQEGTDGAGSAKAPTVYDLLAVTPSRIRGAIRGERRLTDTGKPVVWDLVMFNVNEYHWHRTDWPRWGYTGAIIRCKSPGA